MSIPPSDRGRPPLLRTECRRGAFHFSIFILSTFQLFNLSTFISQLQNYSPLGPTGRLTLQELYTLHSKLIFNLSIFQCFNFQSFRSTLVAHSWGIKRLYEPSASLRVLRIFQRFNISIFQFSIFQFFNLSTFQFSPFFSLFSGKCHQYHEFNNN